MEAVEFYGTSMNRIKRNENTGCLCVILQYPQDHELRWQPKQKTFPLHDFIKQNLTD